MVVVGIFLFGCETPPTEDTESVEAVTIEEPVDEAVEEVVEPSGTPPNIDLSFALIDVSNDSLYFGPMDAVPDNFAYSTLRYRAEISLASDRPVRWTCRIVDENDNERHACVVDDESREEFKYIWDGQDNSGILLPDARYRFIVSAKGDAAVSGEESYEFIVDTTRPVVAIENIHPGQGKSYAPQFRYNFSSEQIARARVSLSGVELSGESPAFPSFALDASDNISGIDPDSWRLYIYQPLRPGVAIPSDSDLISELSRCSTVDRCVIDGEMDDFFAEGPIISGVYPIVATVSDRAGNVSFEAVSELRVSGFICDDNADICRTSLSSLLFQSNRASFNDEGTVDNARIIKDVIAAVEQSLDGYDILLVGHANPITSNFRVEQRDSLLPLSLCRAYVVREELLKRFGDRSEEGIIAVGRGGKDLVTQDRYNPAASWRNRRVDLLFYRNKSYDDMIQLLLDDSGDLLQLLPYRLTDGSVMTGIPELCAQLRKDGIQRVRSNFWNPIKDRVFGLIRSNFL